MSEPARDPVERFAAYAVIAAGALIAALAGLCSGGFLVMSGMWAFNDRRLGESLLGVLGVVPAVGLFGGPPILIGLLVFRWGRRLLGPWERVWGRDPMRTVAGWAMLAIGLVISAATLLAAVFLAASALKDHSGYAVLFLPLAGFGLAIVAPLGLSLMVEGYRLGRGPTPPPSPPPPP